MADSKDVLCDLSARITEIRYALIGIASEEEDAGGAPSRTRPPAEALSFAADLLGEAAKSLKQVADR